jgi:hypothetical protein
MYIMSSSNTNHVAGGNLFPDATIQQLEKDGNKQVDTILSGNKPVTVNTFMNIVKNGADEFKAKTGRTMTYSEMREAFG